MAKYKREDVIKLMKHHSGYFMTDLKVAMSALEKSLIEILSTVEDDDPVEIQLFPGFYLYARKEPERPATDPRNGEVIVAREKIKARAQIRRTFRLKIENAAGMIGGEEETDEFEEE